MPTLKTIDLRCPNCEHRFESGTVDVPGRPARKRTDFQEETAAGLAPPHDVHLCERCGFAGPAVWFSESDVSPVVRQHVWDELTPRISRTAVPTSEKYEFAAKVAGWDGAPTRDIAELWLRAAWCCVEEGDIEAERYYRRHAAWAYEELLKQADGVERDQRASLTYLVGELWRRIGDEKKAKRWFQAVPDEITNRRDQGWVAHWALRQRTDPREWFD